MASLDLEKLLQEISADSPCGSDMEYEPEFQELERSTQYRAEQVIGDAVVEALEPNWQDVQRAATALFAKTKDLRVAVYLARAALHNEGFPGFRDGLSLIKSLLEKYWDTVHPRLDPEDNNDPTIRVNTVSGLSDPETVLRSVRKAPVVAARGVGQFSIRDIDIAKGISQPAATDAPSQGMGVIDAAFTQAELPGLQATAEAVKQARESVTAIEKLFTEKVSAARSPNLAELNKILYHIGNELNEQLGRRGVAAAGAAGDQGNEAFSGAKSPTTSISGAIQSREDVIRMLDKICDFYKQNEPSHPLPMLLQRAKRLVRKDFMEILKDIAPDAVKQAELLKGKD